MSYDPTLPTLRDYIRKATTDTSNDAATELVPDATYDAVIAMYGADSAFSYQGLRATADMSVQVAEILDQNIVNFGATNDMTIGWGDRAKTLRANATWLRDRADLMDPVIRRRLFTISTVGQMVVDGQDF